MKVHDRDDVDAVSLDSVQKAVRELRNQNTPESATKRCSRGWGFQQALVRPLNGEGEVESQPLALVLVEPSGQNELVLCLGMKLNPSHRSAARTFLRTRSAGIAATFPDLRSARRRSASASQSRSASASTSGSRLERRRCARRARCRRESFMASDSSARVSLAIRGGYHDGRGAPESASDHAAGHCGCCRTPTLRGRRASNESPGPLERDVGRRDVTRSPDPPVRAATAGSSGPAPWRSSG